MPAESPDGSESGVKCTDPVQPQALESSTRSFLLVCLSWFLEIQESSLKKYFITISIRARRRELENPRAREKLRQDSVKKIFCDKDDSILYYQ